MIVFQKLGAGVYKNHVLLAIYTQDDVSYSIYAEGDDFDSLADDLLKSINLWTTRPQTDNEKLYIVSELDRWCGDRIK